MRTCCSEYSLRVLFAVVVCVLALPAQGQTIYFVDANSGDDDNDGESWSDAFASLQRALIAATEGGSQIWVAKGTYDPLDNVTCDPPEAGCEAELTFEIDLDLRLQILGGFENGDDIVDRDPDTNVTILSGDILGDDANSPAEAVADIQGPNSIHILTLREGNNPSDNFRTLIDGFTIT